jgi:hypothetical protein
MPLSLRICSTALRSASVTATRSAASCNAFSSPNKFGSARKMPNTKTTATNAIFQRG